MRGGWGGEIRWGDEVVGIGKTALIRPMRQFVEECLFWGSPIYRHCGKLKVGLLQGYSFGALLGQDSLSMAYSCATPQVPSKAPTMVNTTVGREPSQKGSIRYGGQHLHIQCEGQGGGVVRDLGRVSAGQVQWESTHRPLKLPWGTASVWYGVAQISTSPLLQRLKVLNA